jgi:hypothetical protein
VSWTSGTPDQYPESWWWMNHGQNVLALTYEDMNCDEAGLYDSTANAIVRGIIDYLGLEFVGNDEENEAAPSYFGLKPAFPNPFNPIITIPFNLPESHYVEIVIIDILGQVVTELSNETWLPGQQSITWNANQNSSGVYFIHFSSGTYYKTQKILLLK